jgi:hypothetical protein
MTEHCFKFNLYHKENEKSKKYTKYCGHDRLPMQYLDVLKERRLIRQDKTRQGKPCGNHSHDGFMVKMDRSGYFRILGTRGRKIKIQEKTNSISSGDGISLWTTACL